jgi:hypothetical protein
MESGDDTPKVQNGSEKVQQPAAVQDRQDTQAMLVHELVIPGGEGPPATLSVPKAATVVQLKAIWAQLDALKVFLEAQAKVRNPLQGESAAND